MCDRKYTLNIDLQPKFDQILDDIVGEMITLVRAARNHYRDHTRMDVTVDVQDLLAKNQTIGLFWSVDDVLAARPDLTRDQAWEVLENALQQYEPDTGLTTYDLETLALHLFGTRPTIPASVKAMLQHITLAPTDYLPYQCFLRDGRCVLIRRDLSTHVVINSPFSVEDDTPYILPINRVPKRVYEILEQVIAETSSD